MSLDDRVLEQFRESVALKQASEALVPTIVAAGHTLTSCLLNDGKILSCGNGGSASDAQHFSGEMLGRFEMERPSLPIRAILVLRTGARDEVGSPINLGLTARATLRTA